MTARNPRRVPSAYFRFRRINKVRQLSSTTSFQVRTISLVFLRHSRSWRFENRPLPRPTCLPTNPRSGLVGQNRTGRFSDGTTLISTDDPISSISTSFRNACSPGREHLETFSNLSSRQTTISFFWWTSFYLMASRHPVQFQSPTKFSNGSSSGFSMVSLQILPLARSLFLLRSFSPVLEVRQDLNLAVAFTFHHTWKAVSFPWRVPGNSVAPLPLMLPPTNLSLSLSPHISRFPSRDLRDHS